ncbi:MAG TPA: YbaB/EbfC family nucleoid-associated protein [Bacillota bacterium]|nr:YbaB/EbfC family nucleoid-associated protein [Bacillota bacterium]
MRGMGNMGNMMKQMQQMQKKMVKAQEELHAMEFEASSGGGMVTVTANGNKEILDITIEEEVVDPEDVEMLQDLVIAAMNDVLKQIDDKTEETMGQFTKGLNLPGGMF